MKTNRIRSLFFVAALGILSGSSAFGVATITISGNSDYRAGLGGEFNVRAANQDGENLIGNVVARGYVIVNGTTMGTANGTAMGGSSNAAGFGFGFETFCIEYNEYINLPGTYTAAISLGSIYGGVAGGIDHDSNSSTPTTDLVSLGTAFLYEQFAMGDLSGYNYTNGGSRAASAVMLQNAIWYLEDEISLTSAQIAANTFLQAAFAEHGVPGAGIGNNAGGAKTNNNIYNVAALNMGGAAPNQKQDQLILHDNGFSVPDGGTTVMLMGLGLSGLALLRRKLS